ncbi:uncharacterized protein LOC126736765 [Anthonomus grandis grandis]|uniref:uncharacterized protein LOC126736765 n=1 Tax=Anthonomus grandis grandis TaxID=2921223 RepID=UPI0021651615|nr:uncharacterized protein LOC126736765 [Anthonomus grandis grandis]
MVSRKESKQPEDTAERNYVMEAPDGGWGYVIVLATVVIFGVTIIPMAAFGIVYGPFLRQIGDETTGTTMSTSMFNTINSFTGLLASGLLNKFSYRKVSFMGSFLFIAGTIGLIFAQNLIHLIIFFGIIEGLGFGLLMPASLSAFNSYFNKKMAVMMSVCQALMIAFNMAVPQLAEWSMKNFGFRGTLIGLSGLASLTILASVTLQPVKKHMKKVCVEVINSTVVSMDAEKPHEEPLLKHYQKNHIGSSQRSLHSHQGRARKSIVSLGDHGASVTNINDLKDDDHKETESFWQSFASSMDMSLLKDCRYLNISIGLALAFTGDMTFISIIPLTLRNSGFNPAEIATMMSVFFASDLVARIILTIVSSLVKFRSRFLILATCVCVIAGRIALLSNNTYMWTLSVLSILGFLRCFIQTPLPLVFSEEYQDQFSTAYSLFMAVNGVVSLVIGPLMSVVKSVTGSDFLVCHILTVAYVICVIAWVVELTFCKRKTEEHPKEGKYGDYHTKSLLSQKNRFVRFSLKKNMSKEDIFSYAVFISVTIIAILGAVPLCIFGITYGPFLANLGDETTGTSLANAAFNTVMSMAGLLTNVLLNIWSCRNVGLLGALFCLIGSFSLLLVNDFITFLVMYGFFQGLGYGILLPTSLTALTDAFDKRLTLMMSLSQAIMVACCMVLPPCVSAIITTCGYRTTVLFLSGLTVLSIPSAMFLTKFKCSKEGSRGRYLISNIRESSAGRKYDLSVKSKSVIDLRIEQSRDPLLKKHNSLKELIFEQDVRSPYKAISALKINRGVENSCNKRNLMDFSLFKSGKYLNICTGLALSYTSDIYFITILPVVLGDLGFEHTTIANTVSIFFGSDLVSRIVLAAVSSFTVIKSRHLVFYGSVLSVIFRFGFALSTTFVTKLVMLSILGFLRSLIQTPFGLVMAEEYPDNFSTAFSLFMVFTGILMLAFGPLISITKSLTGSNEMVCYLLTSCYVICIFLWGTEMILDAKKKDKRASESPNSKI